MLEENSRKTVIKKQEGSVISEVDMWKLEQFHSLTSQKPFINFVFLFFFVNSC